jgi:hypothetical protein
MISTSVMFFNNTSYMFLALKLFSVFRSIKVKIAFVKISIEQISLISKVLQIRGCVAIADIQIVVFLLLLQILINHDINIITDVSRFSNKFLGVQADKP